MDILLTVLVAIVVAETSGYFIHVLIHSNKIAFLTRSHMIHHLVIYGPKTGFFSQKYKYPELGKRFLFLNIGLEWWIPVTLVLLLIFSIAFYYRIPGHILAIFTVVTVSWTVFFYKYMHEAMHLEGFWMLKNKRLKNIFLAARKRHEIHHLEITNDGLMNTNYGICFYIHDLIFRTYQKEFKPFNEKGYQAAKNRYSFIYNSLGGKEEMEQIK